MGKGELSDKQCKVLVSSSFRGISTFPSVVVKAKIICSKQTLQYPLERQKQ